MKKIIISLACGTAILCGCATGTHIVTGKQRPAITPEQVTIYQTPPAKFEVVGIVNSTSPGKTQNYMDLAVQELKIEAGQIGANGVIIGGMNPGSQSVGISTGYGFGGGTSFGATGVGVSATGIQLSGEAIFVSQ